MKHIPYLQKEIPKLPEILANWKEYKQSVPTYGAIILSEGMTHVLLVQSYWAKSSWGFPKGKVNEEEDPAHCAAREVLEETGFDISNLIDPNEFLESVINDQLVRLYIVRNVPMSTKFQPKTRCEIKACSWFAIGDLPNNKKDATPKLKIGVSPNAFFMVLPFVKRIKALCNSGSITKRQRHKSASISEGEYSTAKNKTNNIKNGKCETDEVKHNKKRQDKNNSRQYTKRQLFPEKDRTAAEFCAPSWLNFKFDKTAIMECMP